MDAVTRACVEQNLMVKIKTRGWEEVPVDINAVWGHRVKQREEGCFHCGKPSRWKKDRWQLVGKKGKGPKGGPGTRKRKDGCWSCGSPDQLKRDCPKVKGKGQPSDGQGKGKWRETIHSAPWSGGQGAEEGSNLVHARLYKQIPR